MNIDRDSEFIGDYVFCGCTSLKSVIIWRSDIKIGTGAFGNICFFKAARSNVSATAVTI